MIKLTCIKDINGAFIKGEDYALLQRRGGGFVEVLSPITGREMDFIMKHHYGAIGYYLLRDYFNLVPTNKRMVFFEKINHICYFDGKKN